MKTSQCLRGHRGQVLVLFVLFLVVLLMVLGLVVDGGMLYVTKASMAKAADSACLTGIRNLSQGTSKATELAQAAFTANYNRQSRILAKPDVSVAFTKDAGDNTLVTVSVRTSMKTAFIGIIPVFKTVSLKAEAQAMRSRLVMSLVLDRSGSMGRNGGSKTLGPSVTTFINMFDDTIDQAGMVSFASHARNDVAIQQPFRNSIGAAAKALSFAGGTFSEGGLTNALVQVRGVAASSGDNVTKVVVFFTDGRANVFQDRFNCSSSEPSKLMNIGGYVSAPTIGLYNPSTGASYCSAGSGTFSCCSRIKYDSTKFRSIDGKDYTINWKNVTAESKRRAIAHADAMRQEGIIVYSIAMGNPKLPESDPDSIDDDFLYRVSNDPLSAAYNPNLPVGSTLIVPSPDELEQAFQVLATRILTRLTR